MRQFAGAYIDGILIYTKALEDRRQALRKDNYKLRQESFFAGRDKCSWHNQKSSTVDLSLASMASGLSHGNYWQFDNGLTQEVLQT